jgi:sugar O-acyltransferase (sialic acid O-acetyltransferase NeuD family)
MPRKLVIFGAGQIAETAWHCFTHDSDREVCAFAVDDAYRASDELLGLPVTTAQTLTERFPPDDFDIFVAMSYKKLNRQRAEKVRELRTQGYRCVNYVSSRAIVNGTIPEDANCFVLELNNIQPFARLGDNVFLWSGNHIGHHAVIGDNCFVASHVVVSGAVEVGANSFIGVNATIRDGVKIGIANVIGAGALILADTEDSQVFIGPRTEASRVPSHRLRDI